ncbi:dihydroorotase-like cyclic amidohydrolase [Xanthomonas arboricola]|nr:dihydroorotase-like cyclic amidohydrolase [Xanthomonas euroxanthea]
MNMPILPCHRAAAMVGTVTMSMVMIRPMPPCCRAWLLEQQQHRAGGHRWVDGAEACHQHGATFF